MVTVPIDLALSVAVGSTVALASRSTVGEYKLLRSPALWSLVVYLLLVFAPIGAYLLWRFPAWSLMYLLDPASLPMPPPYLAVLYPVIAVGAYVGCRRLLMAGRTIPALGVAAAGVLLAVAIGFFGSDQVLVVGSTEDFRADPGQMRELVGTSLSWIGAAGLLAAVIGWGATLWRLMLLGRVTQTAATATVEHTAEPKKKPKPKRTKKKAS